MSVKPLRAIPQKPVVIDVPIVGSICGYDQELGLLVDFPQNPTRQPVPARWTMLLDQAAVEQAVQQRQAAVLVFEEGDPLRPIVTGLVQPRLLSTAAVQLPSAPTDVKLDGKRLALEAADEIVLRCGQASLALRRNGTVVIRGTHLISHSSGMNRIRGGAVHIN